jgi:hypothetical protein
VLECVVEAVEVHSLEQVELVSGRVNWEVAAAAYQGLRRRLHGPYHAPEAMLMRASFLRNWIGPLGLCLAVLSRVFLDVVVVVVVGVRAFRMR